MNDQTYNFETTVNLKPVDNENQTAVFDKPLRSLFPDERLGVSMPDLKWKNSYKSLDLSSAQITLDYENGQILVRGFNAAGEFKDQIKIPLCEEKEIDGEPFIQQRSNENLRFQIQYALGQLGALVQSNGGVSGTTKPTINHFDI